MQSLPNRRIINHPPPKKKKTYTLDDYGAHTLKGTNMLSNTTSLSSSHRGVAQEIQKRCLAMVYMAHDRNNRWTRLPAAGVNGNLPVKAKQGIKEDSQN